MRLLPSHYMASDWHYEWLIGQAPDGRRSTRRHSSWSRPNSLCNELRVLVSEQYAGTVSRAALPVTDDSRQRGSRAPAPDGRVAHHAPARPCRFFDGAEAGVSVGRELSHLRSRIVANVGHSGRSAGPHGVVRLGGSDCRDHRRPGIPEWRLHDAAGQRHRELARTGWPYSQEWWRRELCAPGGSRR